jgi:hypothetical protein
MGELERLKLVLCEVAELRSELERLRKCPSDSSRISGLPENVQDYLHQVDNITEPMEDEAILESARETIEALTRLNVELRKSLNPPLGPEI